VPNSRRDDTLVIAVVRPDVLGTYGDGGNAVVLQQRLERRGIPAEFLIIGAGEVVPTMCDICVLGGGEDGAQAALAEQRDLGISLQRAAERGVAMLAVCAAFQVLGHSFITADGARRPGYGVLDCWTNARLPERAVGEIAVSARLDDRDLGLLSGFENHGGATTLGPHARPLGTVLSGVGNGDGNETEGAQQGSIIGTYLHGPVLARNPALADAILEMVVGPLPPLDVPGVEGLRAQRLGAVLTRRRARRRTPSSLRGTSPSP